MKDNNSLRNKIVAVLFTGSIFISNLLSGQGPPPPDPPGSHGSGTNQSPSGAPIDSGLTLFLAFALGYGAREGIKAKRKTSKS